MEKPDKFIERKILIGLIVSDDFISAIAPIWSIHYMEASTAKLLSSWCVDYFKKYNKAPFRDIEGIFTEKIKKGMQKDDIEYISEILESLNEEYEDAGNFNSDYLIDQTKQYFSMQRLKQYAESIMSYVEEGDIVSAEKEALSFVPSGDDESSHVIDPFSNPLLIKQAFTEQSESLIRFPKALGQFWNDQLTRGAFIAITGPEKRGKCITGTQRVLLASGEYMSVNDIIANRVTDIVSFDESTQTFVKTKIAKFWKNGIKKVYCVKTRTGREVEITGNHPLLTPDGWKELGEIKKGEFIVVPKHIPFFGTKKLEEYKIKLLAYFIADGCTLAHGQGHKINYTVQYTKKDKEVQEDFTECIRMMGGETVWKNNECRINKNIHIRNFLKDTGVWNKHSYEKTIPDIIYQLDESDVRLFLQTLFTGDGWVNKKDSTDFQIGYATASKLMAKQIHGLLLKFGIVSKLAVYKTTCRDTWNITIQDYHNMKLFYERVGFLFEKQRKLEEVVASRKEIYKSFLNKLPWQIAKEFHDKALEQHKIQFTKAPVIREQIVKKCPVMFQSFAEIKDTELGKKYFNSMILWDEIVDIEYVGEQETFDLTVSTHHNFIAEDVLVHNTFWLLEFAMRAMMNGNNVAFFQAGDMTEKQQLRRMAVYLAKRSDRERYCGERQIPCVDCWYNQTDDCELSAREQYGIRLFDPDMEQKKITFDMLMEAKQDYPEYKPCRNCDKIRGAVWLEHSPPVKVLTWKDAYKIMKAWQKKHNKKFKLATYPNETLTMQEISNLLTLWERQDGFVPDVVLIDYADILAPDYDCSRLDGRGQINKIWQRMRKLSQEKHCLLITATQAAASSYDKETLSLSDFSEDKRKYAHTTATYSLNQTDEEKKIGIMRIGELVVRESEFDRTRQVKVLQCLQRGRPFIGSYF